ncbi:MAG: hypothetical protein HY707_10920 [Ignavibacteriae bacterium]|nr:hypothetical protein [Ignavibacteriota bacterium]
MITYDLAIAWNWEFDEDFVNDIEHHCALRGVTTYQVSSHSLQRVLSELHQGLISFHAFYDRASDADRAFLPLVHALQKPMVKIINLHDLVIHAIDKATMHLEFITNGLQVPYTIILSPYNERKEMNPNQSDFARLGIPFVIKPANTTGGGTGVILNAATRDDVLKARQHHPDDKYLLQEKIIPLNLDGKRAWFRVYCAFGEIILCWWDDITHIYTPVTTEDERLHNLVGLRNTMKTIQQICKLDFFSSEIALTAEGKFVVVDYVNEICDMRLQSKYRNGAPDNVVHRIAQLIAQEVETHVHTVKIITQI